jgi:hypothetical protein
MVPTDAASAAGCKEYSDAYFIVTVNEIKKRSTDSNASANKHTNKCKENYSKRICEN